MGNFKGNYRGLGELLKSPEMEAEMLRRAEAVKARAESTAPFDPKSRDGTHYRDAFRVESSRDGGQHHDRAVARVVNDDPAAFQIEYGTSDTPRHRTLGKALDAAGD
jgi:hypothetical protein